MHYVYADRWTAALTPRVFSGPLLDSLQWDDTTWSQCVIRHRRDARPATLPPIWHNRENSTLIRSRPTALGWSNIEMVDDDLRPFGRQRCRSCRHRAGDCRGLPWQGQHRGGAGAVALRLATAAIASACAADKLASDDCKIRSQCTNVRFRTASRLENEAVLDRMQARLAQRPSVLNRWREAVEHPFGSIKPPRTIQAGGGTPNNRAPHSSISGGPTLIRLASGWAGLTK
jgi:hypothetical protein